MYKPLEILFAKPKNRIVIIIIIIVIIKILNLLYEDGIFDCFQVVWAKTKKVGCSRAFCPVLIDENGAETGTKNVWIESCQYYPG